MAITRIKENQITDLAVTNAKIANATIAGGKLATNLSYGSDLTVTGNLTVSGTTVAVATTNTRINDALLVLANGTSGSPSEDSGFIIDRGSSNNMAFLWDESADVFILCDVGAEDGDTVGNVTVSGTRQTLQMGPLVATTISGSTITGTGALVAVAGTFSGTLTANAGLAVAASQTIDFNANKITEVGDPTADQDAATKKYVDDNQASFIISDGSTTQTIADGNTITFTAVANETTVAVSATDTVTIGMPNDVTIGGVLTVTGNLVVNGTTTTVATTNTVVKDTLLELNSGAGSNANDMGLIMERGSTGDNAIFIWDESADEFAFGTTTAVSSATGNISVTAAGINASTGAFSGVVTAGGFTIGSAAIVEAELETIDGVTAGTVAASKAVVVDGNLDIASFRNVSMTGNLNITDAGALRIGTGNDFQIAHDGTNTTIANTTGIMAFNNTAGSAFRFNENSADVDFIVETNGNAAALHVDGGNNNVGVGGAPNANAAFHVNSTGSMLLPVGSTAQRPTAVTGMFRYNSTTAGLEYYDADSWESVSSSFTIATTQAFDGDGSAVAFTLSALSGSDSYTTAGVLVMLNGVVQVPTTVYSVSGVTLTFTTAPASGDKIDVRKFTTTTTVVNLSDADGDTLVQTEESSDEDKIRFDCGGSQIALIDSNGITLSAGTLVGTADLATSITAVANNSTDETVYPTFVDAATGTQGIETDTGLTYNPSSGTLTSTIFAGTANAAKYADLAERYASDEEIEPGTVVQFVGEGKVAMCMNDSSRSVAGIVSTDPAYLMNSDQAGISLAIAGRVPCKVIGTVKTGDLMVCAGEGYARAEENPALGTVIGKAIESHSGTTGVIEVLTMMM